LILLRCTYASQVLSSYFVTVFRTMGPTITNLPEFHLKGVSEYLVIEQGDIEKDFSDHASSLSSSDGDSSMSDDIFSEYQSQSIARRSKENRPQHEPNVPHGGMARGCGEEESYRNRRQRNNAAVKRSRDKARQRQKESQRRLAELTAENRRLQMKADVLLKELSLLRGLFPAVDSSGGVVTQQLLSDVDIILVETSG